MSGCCLKVPAILETCLVTVSEGLLSDAAAGFLPCQIFLGSVLTWCGPV